MNAHAQNEVSEQIQTDLKVEEQPQTKPEELQIKEVSEDEA